MNIKNRANEEWQKRDVMEKLLKIWIDMPYLRLGQLILNAQSGNDFNSIYNIEDYELIDKVYKFYEQYKEIK